MPGRWPVSTGESPNKANKGSLQGRRGTFAKAELRLVTVCLHLSTICARGTLLSGQTPGAAQGEGEGCGVRGVCRTLATVCWLTYPGASADILPLVSS